MSSRHRAPPQDCRQAPGCGYRGLTEEAWRTECRPPVRARRQRRPPRARRDAAGPRTLLRFDRACHLSPCCGASPRTTSSLSGAEARTGSLDQVRPNASRAAGALPRARFSPAAFQSGTYSSPVPCGTITRADSAFPAPTQRRRCQGAKHLARSWHARHRLARYCHRRRFRPGRAIIVRRPPGQVASAILRHLPSRYSAHLFSLPRRRGGGARHRSRTCPQSPRRAGYFLPRWRDGQRVGDVEHIAKCETRRRAATAEPGTHATNSVEKAMEVAGGAAFYRDLGLEAASVTYKPPLPSTPGKGAASLFGSDGTRADIDE